MIDHNEDPALVEIDRRVEEWQRRGARRMARRDMDRAARNIAYALGLVAAIDLGVRVEAVYLPVAAARAELRLAGLWSRGGHKGWADK